MNRDIKLKARVEATVAAVQTAKNQNIITQV
jgi:hypothetical protein